ncbi:hypothetical protein EVAR_54672_1 [Eumeta japonica]|uniref:Uncharacterized protein n=1 Tax=Eumeta variegata TaxID=151549 RepID=A0A4C1X562_EUMVA|nr:hypothetical protein EVAR_54672_1 [Eumeta japonica]
MSSSRKYLNGSEKRKRKRETEEKNKKSRKISRYLKNNDFINENASGECSESEELDLTKSIPELPDAAPDTSIYLDPKQPQQVAALGVGDVGDRRRPRSCGASQKKAYCEPCWLFVNWASKKIQNVWMDSYDGWKQNVDAIERHETLKIQLDSCLTYQQWRLHRTLDEEQESVIKKEKSSWR